MWSRATVTEGASASIVGADVGADEGGDDGGGEAGAGAFDAGRCACAGSDGARVASSSSAALWGAQKHCASFDHTDVIFLVAACTRSTDWSDSSCWHRQVHTGICTV